MRHPPLMRRRESPCYRMPVPDNGSSLYPTITPSVCFADISLKEGDKKKALFRLQREGGKACRASGIFRGRVRQKEMRSQRKKR